MQSTITLIGSTLLVACISLYILSFLLKELIPDLSGTLYKGFFHSFKTAHRSLVLFPIRVLYFFYFPTEYKLRKALTKPQFSYSGKGIRKFLSVFRRPGYRLNLIRFKNVKSSVTHSPASTFSIILSYLGFILSIAFFLLSKTSAGYPHKIFNQETCVIMLIVCFILLIPLPAYLRFYILNLPVEAYASLITSSLNDSQMIAFTSYKIWRVCNRFEGRVKWLVDNLEENHCLVNEEEKKSFRRPGKPRMLPDQQKNRIRAAIQMLQKNKRKLDQIKETVKIIDVELVRISTLIKYCAQRLKISEEKLEANIFQFSPVLYAEWTKAFINNISDALSINDQISTSGPLTRHDLNFYNEILNFLAKCNSFYKRNVSFQRYQVQNIAFSDLHDHILAYTSQPSGCEAVKAYIATISKIAEEIRHYDGSQDTEMYCIEKFAYAFYKRKTHNGLDLHYSAYRLLQNIVYTSGYVDTQINEGYEDLLSIFEPQQFAQFLKDPRASGERNNHLELLARLYSYSISYIDDCHDKIRQKFVEKYQDFFSVPAGQHLYVAMFGFSQTVIDIIKYAIPEIIGKIAAGYMPGQGKGWTEKDLYGKIKIAVFASEEESKSESVRKKCLLTLERESKDLNVEVLIRSEDSLLSVMDTDSKLLLLLGTEAYDCGDRIIGTSPSKMSLKNFIAEAKKRVGGNDRHIKVAACAESFKCNEDLRSIEAFFGDQYDKIEIYEPDLVTDILSDDICLICQELPPMKKNQNPAKGSGA